MYIATVYLSTLLLLYSPKLGRLESLGPRRGSHARACGRRRWRRPPPVHRLPRLGLPAGAGGRSAIAPVAVVAAPGSSRRQG
eukprot:jgi/Mesvir1/6783/Mv25789-RA.1